MLFHVEHNVQIATRPAVGASFAFTRNTQPGARIHARRNPQIDGLVAFDAALPPAIGATLFDNLTGALASRASSGDGEKSLLIRELPASAAGLARTGAGS